MLQIKYNTEFINHVSKLFVSLVVKKKIENL